MSKPVTPTLEIRSGIPVPPRRWMRKSVPITLSKMNVDQHVDIPLSKGYGSITGVHQAAKYVGIKVSVRTYVNGEDYITTDVVKAGEQFIRVWRTE
jgi:hypothetical protein